MELKNRVSHWILFNSKSAWSRKLESDENDEEVGEGFSHFPSGWSRAGGYLKSDLVAPRAPRLGNNAPLSHIIPI